MPTTTRLAGATLPSPIPALLPNVQLPHGWTDMVRAEDFGGDCTITVWQGTPEHELDVQAKGPPMLCIAVFLEGEASMAIDGGPPLHAGPGTAVIQTSDRWVQGRFRMAGGKPVRIVDIRYTPAGLVQAGGWPLTALPGVPGGLLHDHSVPEAGSLMAGFRAPPALLRPAADLVDCRYADPQARRLYLRAKALEALAVVLDLLQSPEGQPLDSREWRLLARARQLLDDRYEEDWTIRRLAQAAGLSEKRLKSGFRAVAGRSVHAYQLQLRLDAAATLLASGRSVTDTALATGFSSLSHFSKMFRQSKGVAPSQWAGQARQADGGGPTGSS